MRSYNKRGFTLSELILASAITALVLAGLIIFFAQCFLISAEARSSTIAVSHAQYIMEDIKNTPFDSIAVSISGGIWNWNSSSISLAGLSPLNAENVVVGCSGTDPLHITVTVNWQNLKGVNKSTVIETLITS